MPEPRPLVPTSSDLVPDQAETYLVPSSPSSIGTRGRRRRSTNNNKQPRPSSNDAPQSTERAHPCPDLNDARRHSNFDQGQPLHTSRDGRGVEIATSSRLDNVRGNDPHAVSEHHIGGRPQERNVQMNNIEPSPGGNSEDAADVAALMLAAVDDREAFNLALKAVTYGQVPGLLHAALEIGATLVRHGDRGASPREMLGVMIEELRRD